MAATKPSSFSRRHLAGTAIPQHFHVTEVGQINKKFIDCGGLVRNEKTVNFQLSDFGDFDHRLAPQKLLNIISLSKKTRLGIEDAEIEVEPKATPLANTIWILMGRTFY